MGVNDNEGFLEIGKTIHKVKIRLDEHKGLGSPWSLVQIQPLPFLYQRPGIKGLASGAEVSAAVLHHDPLDGVAANGATGSYEFRCS